MNTPPDNDGESAPTDEVLSGEVVATPDGADSVDGSPEQPGDLPGALGGLDMGAMLQMAQDMGERMQEAQEALLERLLADPTAFIDSCRRVLLEAGVDIRIETVVRVGHRLSEYASLIEERAVDLLVLNTKDHDQMAMHGLAHPLAVELRQVPLLML